MISQGLTLMLFGMGTVVVFLTLLVASTSIMSRLINRYFPEQESASSVASAATPGGTDSTAVDGQLVAVISAAIKRHRSR